MRPDGGALRGKRLDRPVVGFGNTIEERGWSRKGRLDV